MATVSISEQKMWVDQESIPLLSGEMHYWRLAPDSWRDILERIRDLGLQIVATYVCWDFHEHARGHFDFHGETDPRRDLAGFLELLTEEGFWIIVRPGPYIYSEWRNAGVPDYAARYHRLHPDFLEAARRYLEAVVPVIKPHLATQGGRIILVQADNEIDPWTHWYTEQLGLGNETGLFHDFLRQRYGDVQTLNDAWGTSYEAFEEARATCALPPLNEPDYFRRFLDFHRFRHWYVSEAAQWMVDTYHELGVDVPIYLNTYGTVAIQPWADLEEVADLAGPDLYPTHEFEHRPEEHRRFLEAVRYTNAYSRLPYIPEFQAGIWHGWHYDVGALGPNHYRLMVLSALLAGLAGWNWYMLVNRDNWYMSPINEWGRTRPELFEVFRQLVELYHEIDPTTLIRVTDTAVTFDPLQQAAEEPGQALLRALYDADIDYMFYDVNQGKCAKPLLLYAGGSWLSISAQEKLVEYIAGGGHLVCLGAYPRLDDQLRPANLLEVVDPPGVLGEFAIIGGSSEGWRLALELGESETVTRSPWLFNYGEVPGDPIVVERLPSQDLTAEELTLHTELPAGARYTVGYTEPHGRGRLTVIGLAPTPDLLAALHRHFEIPIPARARTPDAYTSIFQRDDTFYLIVVNNGNEAKAVDVALRHELFTGERYQVRDLTSGKMWEANVSETKGLTTQLPHKDGTILRLAPLAKKENGD